MDCLWLVPVFPFLGFVILVGLGGKIANRIARWVGPLAVFGSMLVGLGVVFEYLSHPPQSGVFRQYVFQWIHVAGFRSNMALYLDALSLVMIFVITLVGFLIHLFAAEYMRAERDLGRFFAAMNLFVGCMLVLVLADDFLFLYLGWEGVGLCSYLLIGFWYHEPENVIAARKAFVVTRIGDTAMAVGLFLIYANLQTLNIQSAVQSAVQLWPVGSNLALLVALLLLGGALGKSAQIPLHTWLPDAMAGPTPVSALIHAATMVTAGFYLIARTHGLFELAPVALNAVAWLGASGLLVGGVCALAQKDIKRVLAYSTMSQVGTMFLALGVGAYSAAVFHFMTHAFFKALLFLAAGVVIAAVQHEQDMSKMGGLRKQMPLVFWCFLIGAGSLAALPWLTAGFYSKEMILWEIWSSENGGLIVWLFGLMGAFLTGLYTFRMVFLVFFGSPKTAAKSREKTAIKIPLLFLAGLSMVAGFVEIPATMGHGPWLSTFLHRVFDQPVHKHAGSLSEEWLVQIAATTVSLAGVILAYWLYARRRIRQYGGLSPGWKTSWQRAAESGLGFDAFYQKVVCRPFVGLANRIRRDWLDAMILSVVSMIKIIHKLFSLTQTGKLRHYVMALMLGAVMALTAVVLF